MNRCPHCGEWLKFVGIRTRGEAWERWDVSPHCGTYVVRDDGGLIQGVTREEPKKGYFNGEPPR